MSNKNKNILAETKDKIVVGTAIGATVIASAVAVHNRGQAGGVPVPSNSEQYQVYTVKPGDTEDHIADRFGGSYDKTAYEDMINSQIPKSDRRNRIVRPGERIRLPG